MMRLVGMGEETLEEEEEEDEGLEKGDGGNEGAVEEELEGEEMI